MAAGAGAAAPTTAGADRGSLQSTSPRSKNRRNGRQQKPKHPSLRPVVIVAGAFQPRLVNAKGVLNLFLRPTASKRLASTYAPVQPLRTKVSILLGSTPQRSKTERHELNLLFQRIARETMRATLQLAYATKRAEQRRAEQQRKIKFAIRCAACGQLFLPKRSAMTCSNRCKQL
jgi:ribosomal protein L32